MTVKCHYPGTKCHYPATIVTPLTADFPLALLKQKKKEIISGQLNHDMLMTYCFRILKIKTIGEYLLEGRRNSQ